jgi:hypothetical protein
MSLPNGWHPSPRADERARRPCRLAFEGIACLISGDLVMMRSHEHEFEIDELTDIYSVSAPRQLLHPWKVDVPSVSDTAVINLLHDMRFRSPSHRGAVRMALGFDEWPAVQYRGYGWIEGVAPVPEWWVFADDDFSTPGRPAYSFQLDGGGSWEQLDPWYDA